MCVCLRPELQVGASLFDLVVVEFTLSKVVDTGLALAKKAKARLRGKPWQRSGFDLPKKMVAMLYFIGLTFAAQPFCPCLMPVVTAMLGLNLKFAVVELQAFLKKPTTAFRAQDAGNFFVQLYLVTLVALGWSTTRFLMQGQDFVRDCAIFDAPIGACIEGTYNPTYQNCTVDPSSKFHEFLTGGFAEELSGTWCTNGYPACFCGTNLAFRDGSEALACGVFGGGRGVPKLFEVMRADLVDLPGSRQVYRTVTRTGALTWLLAFVLLMVVFRLRNALVVSSVVSREREAAFNASNTALQHQLRRTNRLVTKLKLSAGLADGTNDGEGEEAKDPSDPTVPLVGSP